MGKIIQNTRHHIKSFSIFSLLFFSLISFSTAQDKTWLTDITKFVGLDSARGSRISIVDIDNDNYPDLLWGTGNAGKNHFRLYKNIPNPDVNSPYKRIFKDVTEESGICVNRDPNKKDRVIDVANMADVDNDGDMDLVTSIYYHRWEYYNGKDAQGNLNDPGDRSEVYLNDGTGHFTLMPNNGLHDFIWRTPYPAAIFNTAGMIDCSGIAFLDYDQDGIIDIYMSTWWFNYAVDGTYGSDSSKWYNCLFKGNGDGSFTYVKNSGIEKVKEPTYGVNVTDWNDDGWQDVFTSAYCRSGGTLWKNNGNGTFTDASVAANYNGQEMSGDNGQALCNWEAQPADFDHDGDLDLLQVQVHGGFDANEGRTHIMINNGSSKNFRYNWDINRIERIAPSETHVSDQGGQWIDIDGDGYLDIMLGQMGYPQANVKGQEHLYICRQNKENYFDDISSKLGVDKSIPEAHSEEPVDFDLDGDQDIFVSYQVRDTTFKDTIINGQNKKVVSKIENYMQVALLRNDIGNKNNWISIKLDQPDGCNKSGIGSRIYCYADGLPQITEIQAGLGHFSSQQPFIRNLGLGQKNFIDSIVVRWPNNKVKPTTIYNPPLNAIIEIDQKGLKENVVKNFDGTKAIIKTNKPFGKIPTVDVGKDATETFEIMNIGDAPLQVSNLKIINDSSKVYSLVTTETSFEIAPKSSKSITYKFAPNVRNDFYSSVEITSNAYNQPVKLFDLRCSGYLPAPFLTYSLPYIVFDSLYVGQSIDTTLKIINTGELPLTIQDVTMINDTFKVFSILSKPENKTLNTNESADVKIRFNPQYVKYSGDKAFYARIITAGDQYNKNNSLLLIGFINGPKPYLTFNDKNIGSCQVGSTIQKSVVLNNSGDGILSVNKIELLSGDTDIITFSDALPIQLNPVSSIDLNFSFSPKEAKKYEQKFNIHTNAYKDSIKVLTLTGTGKPTEVSEANLPDNSISLKVFPNPVNDLAIIEIMKNTETPEAISLSLIEISGNIVCHLADFVMANGSHKLSFDAKKISSGSYFIVLTSGKNKIYLPVNIQK